MINERRVKIFSIDERDILDLFTWGIQGFPEKIFRLTHESLPPKDCEILATNYNWQEGCYEVLISHPSFPEVKPGDEIERTPKLLGVLWETVEHMSEFKYVPLPEDAR